jgi:hypothetical protein
MPTSVLNSVLTVGYHVTNYYYNKSVLVENTLILKLKITITVKNISSDTKMDK